MSPLPFDGELTVCLLCIAHAIALLIVANGAPIIANNVLGRRCSWPIDNSLILRDGRRLFGSTKTWRGLCASIFLTLIATLFLNIKPVAGALFAAFAMAGDLITSFIKRRLACIESSRARGLDTAPESLLPLYVLKDTLALGAIDILLAAMLFFVIEEFVSPILYRLRLRKRPY